MRFATQALTFILTAATLVSALPVDKVNQNICDILRENNQYLNLLANTSQRSNIQEREELYPGPFLGRIKVEDKREEIYPRPIYDKMEFEGKDKREELYPYPDLGRIKVEDD